MNHNTVKNWKSIKEAANGLNVDRNTISRWLKNKAEWQYV